MNKKFKKESDKWGYLRYTKFGCFC